jgi:uncharacterized repeat protein (TIGR01451 family)
MGTNQDTNAVPGTMIEYDLQIVNDGPDAVTGATVSDLFPAAVMGVTFTATGSPGTAGFTADGTGNIADTVDIPANGSILYVATGLINSGAVGTLSNTGTVTAPAGVDPDTTNDSNGVTVPLTPKADLKITKTDNRPSGAVPGQTITYTITVTNLGPSDAVGAGVADNFPVAVAGVTFTAVPTGNATGFTASGNGNIADTVTMPAGSTITYTATGTIDHAAAGTLTNVATVNPPGGTTDPDLTNNTAFDPVALTPQADLKITKTDNKPSGAVPGTAITYTITVTNLGPSDAAGALVADNFPGAVAGVTFTAVQTGGATGFTASGSGNISDIVSMPPGSIITYTATGTINHAAPAGTLTNIAGTAAPPGTTDPDMTNNLATDAVTLTPRADLQISKTAANTVTAATQLLYTFSISNNGPSDAQAVSISDLLPGGVTFVQQGQSAGTVTVTLSNTGNQINDSIPTLPAGGTATVLVLVNVKASAANTTLMNTATISSTTTDPTPGNNSSTAQTMVQAPVITIAPTTMPDGKVGNNYSQTFTVTGGTGPYTLHETGVLPAGMSFKAAAGGGFTFSGIPHAPGTFHFTLTVTDANQFTGSQQLTWTVAPGNPARVAFLTQPPSILAGGFLPAFTVGVSDQFGNRLNGVTVTLKLIPVIPLGPPGALIAGSVLQAVTVNGVATFHHVGVTGRGGYQLSATAGTGLLATSNLFGVGLMGRHSPPMFVGLV